MNRLLDRGIDKDKIPDWAPKHPDWQTFHWTYANIIEVFAAHLYDRQETNREIWTRKLE